MPKRFKTWWADLGLTAKGLFVVAAPAAATVVIVGATLWLGISAAQAEQQVRQTLTAREVLSELELNDAATSAHLRAYFLTRDAAFLDQFRTMLAAYDAAQQRLSGLIEDPAQAERLSRVMVLHRSRVERIYRVLTRFEAGLMTPAGLGVSVIAKENEFIQIESILDRMVREEDRTLEIRRARVEKLTLEWELIGASCVLAGVIGGVAFSLLFASGITRRVKMLRENVARLATGGELAPMPAGHDEIGDLGDGVAGVARALLLRTAAMDKALHGIAEVDQANRYVSFNRAYGSLAAISGLDSAPGVIETVHPEDRPGLLEAVGRMHASGKAEIEARIVHSGGGIAFVVMTLLPVSAESDHYFVFLRDVSRRKETEAALGRAKEEAIRSNAAKTTFLAKISHDIRTPLNAILGAADLLSQTPLNRDQRDYIQMFQRNARRLVALINDFLDFSKIEAGAVQIERIPLQVRETVEEAMATFKEAAVHKGIALRVKADSGVPAWVYGDSLRLQQVLINLISNALKFTSSGEVDLLVRSDGQQLRFDVTDTGPGIALEQQERIFGAYAQVPRQLPGRAGCGLGLTICRELVELMGGRIGVASRIGVGSTFWFTLPLEIAQPPGAGTDACVPVTTMSWRRGPLVRVLAADDTEDNRLLLKHYLHHEGVSLRFAENGQEALNAVTGGESFDLILMDLDMPVLDGFQAARAIRAYESEKGEGLTPIIGLSAHAMREAVRECLDSGCVAHLAKPIEQSKLLHAICKYARDAGRPQREEVADPVAALVPGYLAAKRQQIEDARMSLAKQEFEPVRRFGHNLKGTGRGYGFPQMAAMGTDIESAALARDAETVERQLEALAHFVAAHQGTPLPKSTQGVLQT